MFGRRYVIEHCVSQLKKISENEALRVYVTDALKAIADNTGQLARGKGVIMTKRFSDFISHEDNEDLDEEIKAEEIKSHMKEVLGKLGKENN